jgi:P-type Ca2+ transporter type 2C
MPNDPSLFASIRGLSQADVEARQKTEGYNELPRPDRRTPLRIILEVVREPMLALLLGGGVVYLALGDLKEALILLAFATLSVVITVVQEARTEHVLEALRDLISPRALVIRDGERKRIAGREVVRGDLVVLAEGDRVPADAVLVQSHDLQTDESLLTGESVPVRKITSGSAAPSKDRRSGGDVLPYGHCHAASGLRSRWPFCSQGDEENQLSRLPLSRDHPAGDLALSGVRRRQSRSRSHGGVEPN